MSHNYSRNAVLGSIMFLGLTGCGFFGDENSDRAASKKASLPPPAAVFLQNYSKMTPTQWLNLSRNLYQEGKYLESIGAAQTAVSLKPDFAEAYNNIGAAYAALSLWDPAIEADQQAVRLNPGMQLARNNLAWAVSRKSLERR